MHTLTNATSLSKIGAKAGSTVRSIKNQLGLKLKQLRLKISEKLANDIAKDELIASKTKHNRVIYFGKFTSDYMKVRKWMWNAFRLDFVEEPGVKMVEDVVENYGADCDMIILDQDLYHGDVKSCSDDIQAIREMHPYKPLILVQGRASGPTPLVPDDLASFAVLQKPLTSDDMWFGMRQSILVAKAAKEAEEGDNDEAKLPE